MMPIPLIMQQQPQQSTKKQKVCRLFIQGKCIKDLKCPFLHEKPLKTDTENVEKQCNLTMHSETSTLSSETSNLNGNSGKAVIEKKNGKTAVKETRSDVQPVPSQNSASSTDDMTIQTVKHKGEKKQRLPVLKPQHNSLKNASQSDRPILNRQLELNSLRTKYKHDIVIDGDDNSAQVIIINHPISDPDFPYDLPNVLLEFTVPCKYPLEPVVAKILNSEIPVEFVERINAYLNYNALLLKGECSIKPLIVMLERNLESLMVAKPVTSSVKIVKLGHTGQSDSRIDSRERLFDPSLAHGYTENQPDVNYDAFSAYGSNDISIENQLEQLNIDGQHNHSLRSITNPAAKSVPYIMPPGFTQISWHVSYSVKNWKGISVALVTALTLQTKCARCQVFLSFNDIQPSVSYTQRCTRCNQLSTVQYFTELLHQYSTVLCYIQLSKSAIVPLSLNSLTIQFECADCEDFRSGPDAKLLNVLTVTNINPADEVRLSCRKCHQKMIFCIDAVQFTDTSIAFSRDTAVKPQKIQGLIIGQPLPERGTCKHYKKSFRWLRFPCCGKVFPCDTCHDEATTDGHSCTWASRMICGHCSRESPVTQGKCACGEYATGIGKSAFWEGGKGMRNAATMSRKDSRKYKGMSKK